MKIFGSIHPFYTVDFDKDAILGIKVAIVEFFRALFRYSSFDEIHLYVKDPSHLNRFKEILEHMEIPSDQAKRISALPNLKLPENLKKIDYQIFFHGDPLLSTLSYLRSNFTAGRPFPVSCFIHDISIIDMPDFLLKLMLAEFFPFDSLICPSQAVKTALAQQFLRLTQFLKQRTGRTLKFPARLVQLPLGVETDKFKPREKDRCREQLKLPQDKIIVLCEGRLTPYFKMDLFPLIQAVKKVTENIKNKNFMLLIVGQEQEKGYPENLRKLAHEMGLDNYVQVVEKFDNKLIPIYFGAADIFISPSDNIQETFGLTPIEAMATGLPAIISDWNGYRESVVEGVTGLKVPTIWAKVDTRISEVVPIISTAMAPQFAMAESTVVDVNKMAEALQKLIENHNLRKKMGQAARQHVLENYSWKAVIKQYEKLWDSSKKQQLKKKIRQTPNRIWPEKIPYFTFYKHYPTRLLQPKNKVKTTATGRSYLASEKLPIPDENIIRIGHPQIMKNILELCLNQAQSVEQILNKFKIKSVLDKEVYLYQILYMIKHDLLSLLDK
jgi:D-inositol-3-phosphate glycosyltransferase